MPTSSVEYLGNLRTKAVHKRSGEVIITDAPIDNEGRGEAFSPTDLLSTSLANCMLTLMGITASKNKFTFHGGVAAIEKHMLGQPRRVGKITVEVNVSGAYDHRQKRLLENAAVNCPVAKSLHPDILQEVTFNYVDEHE